MEVREYVPHWWLHPAGPTSPRTRTRAQERGWALGMGKKKTEKLSPGPEAPSLAPGRVGASPPKRRGYAYELQLRSSSPHWALGAAKIRYLGGTSPGAETLSMGCGCWSSRVGFKK